MEKRNLKPLEVSALGLGCMGMTGFYGHANKDQCIQVIRTAFENGITFLDTADSYGFGGNEELVGAAIAPFRDNVRIATKVGVVRNRDTPNIVSINGTPDYIRQQCTSSLKKLGIPIIDLYYLHHIDPNTPIEDTIQAMAQLVTEGKIRHIGLGEMRTDDIRRAHAVHPICAVQTEYSLFSREAEEQLLPLCNELGIGFVACSPLCRGFLSGMITSFQDLAPTDFRRRLPRFHPENFTHNFSIVTSLQKVAQERACTLSQLALAWVLVQSPTIVPLFGTTQQLHVQDNIKSLGIPLTKDDVDRLNDIVTRGSVRGARYPEVVKQFYTQTT